MIKSIRISLAALAIATCSYAQSWTELAGPYGGTPVDYITDGNNLIVATCGGIFRSTNGGLAWTRTNIKGGETGYAHCIRDLYNDNGVLYAIVEHTVLRSTDAGLNWYPISHEPFNDGRKIAKSSASDDFFVLANNRVYRSGNEGVSWQLIVSASDLSAASIYDLLVHTNGDVYVGTDNSIWRSTAASNGNSFSSSSTGIAAGANCKSITADSDGNFYTATDDDILKSTDGTNWSSVKGTIPYSSLSGNFAISPGNTIYFSDINNGKIYKSENAAASWTVLDMPSNFQSVLFAADNTTLYGAEYQAGILKSSDGGSTWDLHNQGLTAIDVKDMVVTNNGTVIMLPWRGIIRTTDGASFDKTIAGVANAEFHDLYVKSNGDILAAGENIAISTDDGATWNAYGASTVPATIRQIISYNPPAIDVLGTDGNLYSSANDGVSWTPLSPPGLPASYFAYDVAVADNVYVLYLDNHATSVQELYRISSGSATQISYPYPLTYFDQVESRGSEIYGCVWDKAFKSTDYGATWTDISAGTAYTKLYVDNSNVMAYGFGSARRNDAGQWSFLKELPFQDYFDQPIAMGADGTLYAKSSATGLLKYTGATEPPDVPFAANYNWTPLDGPYGGAAQTMHKDALGNIYAVFRDVYKLAVGSTTWTNISASFPNETGSFTVGSGDKLIATSGNSIFFSNNGGTTWTEPTYTNRFDGGRVVREYGSDLWIASYSGVWRSSNNGASWTKMFAGSTHDLELDATGNIYISSGGNLMRSTDGGANFEIVNTGLSELPETNDQYPKIDIDASNNIYIATSSNAFRSSNGTNWTSIKPASMTSSGSNTQVFVQGNDIYLTKFTNTNALYKSSNQGTSWTTITLPDQSGLMSLVVDGLNIYYNDGRQFDNSMHSSSDNGTTWSDRSVGFTNMNLADIEVTTTGRVLVGDDGCGMLESIDGTTWTAPAIQGGGTGSTLVLSDGTLLSCGCVLNKSMDDGNTWTEVGDQSVFSRIVAPGDPQTLYKWETDLAKLYKSTNQGSTWIEIDIAGLPPTGIADFTADTEGNLYVVVPATLYRDVYKVTNGVATRLDPAGNGLSKYIYQGIAFHDGKIYIPTSGIYSRLIVSDDGGDSWTSLNAPYFDDFKIDRSGNFFITNRSSRRFFVSLNKGITWQEISHPGVTFMDAVIAQDGHAYAATLSGGVMKSDGLVLPDDATAPAITILTPSNGANDVLRSATLEITFDEFTRPVAGKKIQLFLSGASTPLFEFEVTDAVRVSQHNNKYTVSFPETLQYAQNYDIVIDAGAFADIFGNASAAISRGAWSIRTHADGEPPLFVHSPPTLNEGEMQVTMSVTITDGSDIKGEKIHYRGITKSTFITVDLTTPHSFNVPASAFDELGLEYYFEAEDAGGLVGQSPTYHAYRRASGSVQQEITGGGFQFGGTVSNWNIISIPFVMENAAVSSMFEELGAYDIFKWRLVTYNSPEAWHEYQTNFTSLERGKGYFINIVEPIDLNIQNFSTPPNSKTTPFTWVLKKGWNQVGNPYPFTISWSTILQHNNNPPGVELLIYQTSYKTGTMLAPFTGGFIYTDSEIELEVPVTATSGSGRTQHPGSDISADAWLINLKLTQAHSNFDAAIGMHPDALQGKDAFDGVAPPRFFDYLEMFTYHDEHFLPWFARDIAPTSPSHEWTFTVDAQHKGTTTISWNNDEFSSSDIPIFLVDPVAARIVDMRVHRQYTFNQDGKRELRINYGAEPSAMYHALGNVMPNPFRSSFIVPLSLPSSQNNFHVSVDAYTSTGQRVGSLLQGNFSGGYQEIEVVPALSNGAELAPGLYILMISVQTETGVRRHSCKVIKSE